MSSYYTLCQGGRTGWGFSLEGPRQEIIGGFNGWDNARKVANRWARERPGLHVYIRDAPYGTYTCVYSEEEDKIITSAG